MIQSISKKTTLWIQLLTVLFITVSSYSCNERVNSSDTDDNGPVVNSIGKKNYFEIATWNIENFPGSSEKTTVNLVKKIILDIDIDLIAVQEITDVGAFNTLMDSLPGWKGILSNDQYSNGNYQKTGILFKSEFISISSFRNIFEDDSYAFPRPPISAHVELKDLNGLQFNFNIIVLHLKAYGDETSEERRRQANIKLESFISSEILNGADADFIVLGDWNDEIGDSVKVEALWPFLEKQKEYQFLTQDIEGYSYPSFPSQIDHILISNDCLNEYGNGETEILDLRKELTNYSSDVSDHLPVMARFKGFTISTDK